MRIVLAGPPKTGNVWLENILALAYDLEILQVVPQDEVAFDKFCRSGAFGDGAIFHQHFSPIEEYLSAAEAIGCETVTVIRNPYDTFVSVFFYVQNFPEAFRAANEPETQLIGRDINDPIALQFLEEGFARNLEQAEQWIASGRSKVVRYEELHFRPVRTLDRLADELGRPLLGTDIARAVVASRASVMRNRDQTMQKHIRAATVGDWMNHLGDAHLAIFREKHAALIRALGYDVL